MWVKLCHTSSPTNYNSEVITFPCLLGDQLDLISSVLDVRLFPTCNSDYGKTGEMIFRCSLADRQSGSMFPLPATANTTSGSHQWIIKALTEINAVHRNNCFHNELIYVWTDTGSGAAAHDQSECSWHEATTSLRVKSLDVSLCLHPSEVMCEPRTCPTSHGRSHLSGAFITGWI